MGEEATITSSRKATANGPRISALGCARFSAIMEKELGNRPPRSFRLCEYPFCTPSCGHLILGTQACPNGS